MSIDAIRVEYGKYVTSDEFAKEWRRRNPKPWKRYVFSVFFFAFPVGIPFGIGIILSGIVKHRKLNRLLQRETEIAAIASPIKSAVLMSNARLRDGPGISAPALVIGAFNGRIPDDAIEDIMVKSMAAHYDSSDLALQREIGWLNDETYVADRRRRLPLVLTGNVEAFAFDLMVHSDWFAEKKLEDCHIWVMATPGSEGSVRQIPHQVLLNAGVVD